MAGKPALASPPVTQEPYRNRDCEDSRAHSFCHAKYTHVSPDFMARSAAPLPEVNTSEPASVTTILDARTVNATHGTRRGDIESVLRLLQSYGEATIVEEYEEPAASHHANGAGEV